MQPRTKGLTYCAIFTALIAIGAFIKIPVPPIPFTLQTMFVALSALMLGAKKGAVCSLIYMLLGLVGLPVFSSGGGISYLLQPTAGFLPGFIAGAYIIGMIIQKKQSPTFGYALFAVLAGYVIIYIIALAYAYMLANFITNQPIAAGTLITSYCLIFIPSDIAKAIASAYVYVKLKKAGI